MREPLKRQLLPLRCRLIESLRGAVCITRGCNYGLATMSNWLQGPIPRLAGQAYFTNLCRCVTCVCVSNGKCNRCAALAHCIVLGNPPPKLTFPNTFWKRTSWNHSQWWMQKTLEVFFFFFKVRRTCFWLRSLPSKCVSAGCESKPTFVTRCAAWL